MLRRKSKVANPIDDIDHGLAGKLDSLLNSATDATVGVDSQGRIVFSSTQTYRLSGYTERELIGQPIQILVPDIFDSGAIGRQSIFFTNPGIPASGPVSELRLQMEDGTDIPVEVGISRFKHDKIVAFFFMRDITDLLQAEESLVESREEFRAVIENAPNAMLIVDLQGHMQLVNSQAEKLFGYPRDELLGHPVELLVPSTVRRKHPEFRAKYSESPQRRTIGRTTGKQDKQLFAQHKDGSQIPVEVTVGPLKSADSMMVVVSVHDLTNRHAKEQELKNAFAEIKLLKSRLEEENIRLKKEVAIAHGFDQIVGDSLALRNCLQNVSVVAVTDTPVLILGDTGTGKELIARAIHDMSPRSDQRLVSVNCAALPSTLIESELFGHEKGAFTGAGTRRLGRFELADGGTLFLDEIGDLPVHLQGKLLRVLQDGDFQRLGGNDTLHVDVRLIAATNRELKLGLNSGEFRADLYYRINTFPIHVPSLDERKEDIPLLAEHFVRKHAARLEKSVDAVSTRLLSHLQQRSWPGNVRELESFIVRCLVRNTGPVLTIVEQGELDPGVPAGGAISRDMEPNNLFEFEHKHLREVIERHGWVIEGDKGAAKALGLSPSTLRSKMKRYGIVRGQ